MSIKNLANISALNAPCLLTGKTNFNLICSQYTDLCHLDAKFLAVEKASVKSKTLRLICLSTLMRGPTLAF